jgi:hypothetical protein
MGVAILDPVPAAVGRVNLVGEHDGVIGIDAELVPSTKRS